MRRLALVSLALGWLGAAMPAPAHAQQAASTENESPSIEYAPPRATATLLTPSPIYLNQKAEVEVTLWRDDAEPDKPAPDFAEVRVRDAIAVRTDYAPPPELRNEDGVRYLLQKRRYLVFPQGIGVIEVPAIEVSWADAEGRARVRTEPLQLEARPPPDAGTRDYVVADSVTLSESIDGNLEGLRVGDSVVRTITIDAAGTDAMMLPATSSPVSKGLAAYPDSPAMTTRIDRGRYKATRADTVTYVAEEWGFYELPPVEVRWFQPATGRWGTERIEARSFRARVNPELGASAFGTLSSNARRALIAMLLLLFGGSAFRLWRGRAGKRGRRLRAWIREARSEGPSERRLFWRVLRAAGRNRPTDTLNATYAWIAKRSTESSAQTLDAVAQRSPDFAAPAVDLQSSLFSEDARAGGWSGRAYASAIRQARRESVRVQSRRRKGLTPLNPES